jgi:guanylate kinase
MPRGGRILTMIGQSGSGKSTQMAELVKVDLFRVLPSTTTRSPRPTDLPQEYRYKSPEEFEELLQTGRLMWNFPAGNQHRYGEDVQDVREALTDPDHIYTNALIPEAAKILTEKYGSGVIKTLFIPSPGDEILLSRMIQRGDSPEKAMERIQIESGQNWLDQAVAIDGIHIVSSQTIADRHQEILEFALS